MRGLMLSAAAVAGLVTACGSTSSPSSSAASTAPAASATPAFAYPPVTHADFVALAATGRASDVQYIKPIAPVSSDACAENIATVSISSTLSAQQQMADLARVFLDQKFDQGCGGILLAFVDGARASAAGATADLTISLFKASTPPTIKMAPINGGLVTVPGS